MKTNHIQTSDVYGLDTFFQKYSNNNNLKKDNNEQQVFDLKVIKNDYEFKDSSNLFELSRLSIKKIINTMNIIFKAIVYIPINFCIAITRILTGNKIYKHKYKDLLKDSIKSKKKEGGAL